MNSESVFSFGMVLRSEDMSQEAAIKHVRPPINYGKGKIWSEKTTHSHSITYSTLAFGN